MNHFATMTRSGSYAIVIYSKYGMIACEDGYAMEEIPEGIVIL